MSYLSEHFSNYDVDEFGNVYKNGALIKPFKSNKYLQVLLFDNNHNRKILGVHVVVAMKYLNYFEGCVVHHKDENTHNNHISNLEVASRSEHSRKHNINNMTLANYIKIHGPSNKGKKMSKEFCQKMSIVRKKYIETYGIKFAGNQYINAKGQRIICPISFEDPNIKPGRN